MKKIIVGLFGLLILALPQVASAQVFTAVFQYSAKFLCGDVTGTESRAGVITGHYNTTINVKAVNNRTALAYRALATKVDGLELSDGTLSDFSVRFNFDRDGGLGIVCRDIKSDLFDVGGTGFFEGYVTIYSNGPLDVTAVLTGEQCRACENLSAMQVYQVTPRPTSVVIRPRPVL